MQNYDPIAEIMGSIATVRESIENLNCNIQKMNNDNIMSIAQMLVEIKADIEKLNARDKARL